MNILVISNGFGEDQIACKIITALQKQNKKTTILALPLVGKGHEYQNIGIQPLHQNPIMPSGGFIRHIGHLIQDIKAGLIKNHKKQYKIIQNTLKKVDLTLCVGDIFCLTIGSYKNPTPVYFLPTAKSDRFMPHSRIERWIMRKNAQLVFPRDALTTENLVEHNVPAQYLGNPMMDNLIPTGKKFDLNTKLPTIGILPGSKYEAYDNLNHILKSIAIHNQNHPKSQYLICKSPTLSAGKLADLAKSNQWTLTNHQDDLVFKTQDKQSTLIITESFIDALYQSQIIIGLSGTANEQAYEIGKTILCFEGFGTQTTKKRFLEQKKLLGDRLLFIEPNTPENIAQNLSKLLDDTTTNTTKPSQSASQDIANTIISHYKTTR